MARQYSSGGRQASGAFASSQRGMPPLGKKSMKERVGALRNLRPFLAMVWRTSPRLTAASLLLRLVRALLPVATLYVGKLIIDEVVRLVQLPDRPPVATGMAAERSAELARAAARRRVCVCRAGRRSRPRRLAHRQPAVGARVQRLERPPHGACGDARP